ncbi:DUF4440 domain-containing protein [Hyphomonas sp.]|uniref:DUF4440 domain-containing protein n=1 Tax=Hyphomonas sp. TaxID=87 RepID=UPI000C6830C0|nr:DUF4440 domain-containing protein [Hyphomonas sp.]MAU65470.1 hypothetical protein [Hyphomonas sp.]MBM59410.1 hypothetical protein [Hyphomonas sp.]
MNSASFRTWHGLSAALTSLGMMSFTACASLQPAPAPQQSEQEARGEVDTTRARFMAAMAASDFAALAEIVDPDAVMIGAGSAGHLKMYAAAGEGLAPEYRIEISPQEFVMMDQEWAFERGTSVQSWQPEGEAKREEVRNSYLLILRNVDGQWKPYREVASALPPPGGWPEDGE